MSNDKVRAEFEAWYENEIEPRLVGGGSLLKTISWNAWEASRAALMVGLPTQCNEGDDYAEGWNNALGWSKAAIEAAGVRVKP